MEQRPRERRDHRLRRQRSPRWAARTSCRSAERIAVFDNDGTLWVEQPIYTQLAFALDRVKALAPQHPDWKDEAAVQGVLDGDMKAVLASGEKGLLELMAATHAGMTTDEFAAHRQRVDRRTAKHPKLKRPYTELVYQPMLEVLAYLRANGFKTYIVSGGGVEFMRPWTERVYGIPPEQVVGSRAKLKYEMRDGKPVHCCGSPRSISSTTAPASRSASSSRSAAGRSRPSATPTATSRCCEWTTAGQGRVSA